MALTETRHDILHDLVQPAEFSTMPGHEGVWIADDTVQTNGSFKLRGASFALTHAMEHTPDLLDAGVFCASAGNHGQGVALAADYLGLKANIFLPETTPACKVEAVEGFGGIVHEVSGTVDEALIEARQASMDHQGFFVHPFDDRSVIEGQASLGREILGLDQEMDFVFVPVGGGGLLAGVCLALEEAGSSTKVVGVQLEGCDAFTKSVDKGKPVTLESVSTLADGTAVKTAGRLTLKIALSSSNFGGMLTVANQELGRAVVELEEEVGVYAETAAGLSYAGLQKFQGLHPGSKVNLMALITGRHRDQTKLDELLVEYT